MDQRTRIPGLDAWRGLGVLFLFHLVFFGRHIEQSAAWASGPDLAGRLASRLTDLLFTSGALGLDMLFLVSGFLVFRTAAEGRRPLALAARPYLRLAPFVAVSGLAYLAYGGVSPLEYLTRLATLSPVNVPGPLTRGFGGADAFLLFSLAASAWTLATGRRTTALALFIASGAAAVLLLVVLGPGWVPVNGHFLSFFWGMGVAWLWRSRGGFPRLPGLLGACLILATMMASRKLSGMRGGDLYFLMDGRDWRTLAALVPLQAVLACGLAASLSAGGFWGAMRPLRALGRMSNCFFMAFVLWSFPLSGDYTHLLASPVWSLAALYAVTLGFTLAVAWVLAPYLERVRWFGTRRTP